MNHRIRRAFTIIELLVVIAIISILIALGFVVAGKVSGSGKQRVTQDALKALESALATYESVHGGTPSPTVPHPWEKNGNVLIPVADAKNCTFNDTGIQPPAEQFTINNSVGLFMLQCTRDVPEAANALKDLDTKIMRSFDPLTATGRAAAAQPAAALTFTGSGSPPTPLTVVPSLNTVMDGWGNPIRYVHPAFKGYLVSNPTAPGQGAPRRVDGVLGNAPSGKTYAFAEFRRGVGDADGGMPTGTRPYFYSCGPDGDPATREDNVYLQTPRFVK
jgi:prepilin-type N-terminal cleavage/methylation domain-containing protein